MRKASMFLSFLLVSCLMQAAVSIIPLPRRCVEKQGTFTVDKQTVIYLAQDNEAMRNAVALWNELMHTAAGYRLEVVSSPKASNVIHCRLNPSLNNEEAYKLNVKKTSIQIEAKTAKGMFYAFQTLRQLMPAELHQDKPVKADVAWTVPCVSIEDEPSFAHRGLMLDVSRHFMPKEVVKRYIDLMAFHKLNIFHWHLTDDQGWRIEIKKYPKLTTVGGYRNKTIIGHARHKPYQWEVEKTGGFYTQEDVKEIVAYAKQRCVEIVPEIEMPGHATAALAAYPQFSCSGGPFEVEGRWGVFNDIFCTKEATLKFMEDVLDEVAALFPYKYIHIGGDEAPRVRWKHCAHCQQRMKQEGLDNEAQLQTYFINRIEKYLSQKGKAIIGWDEIIEGGIPQRATVMSWRGVKGGIHAAKAGYDVIMSPNTHIYLNHYQYDPQTEPMAFGGFTPLEKTYNYHPIHKDLTPAEGKHIKGVQGNLWTEYISTQDQLDYQVYPRAAALAELAWTPKARKDYEDFYQRLMQVEKHYDAMKVNYCKLVYGKQPRPKYAADAVDLALTEKDGSVFATGKSAFTVDGSFVWCGSAIKADEDGKYYLFYSVFDAGKENPPFVDAWILGSKMGVAVSDTPYGNYKDLGVFYNKDGYRPDQSWWDAQYAHNPHIKKFNGKYYLYYIGSCDPGEDAPVKGKVTRRDRIQQSQTLGVICFNTINELLEGKYTCNERPLLTPRSRVKPNNVVNPSPAGTPMKPDNLIMVNPAVEYRPADGKYLLYFKGNVYDPSWRGVHGVAIADHPAGPFEVTDDYVFEFPTENGEKLNAEDPFVWYHRKDQCFYVIFKDFTGAFTKGQPGLAIMSSKDGIHWEQPEQPLFMKKELILKDGRHISVDRLERPQLVLDENDNPIVLCSACSIANLNPKKDGSSFNVQIPIIMNKQ